VTATDAKAERISGVDERDAYPARVPISTTSSSARGRRTRQEPRQRV